MTNVRLLASALTMTLCALFFAAPVPAAAEGPTQVTLTTFAYGNASETLHFRAPCWLNGTSGFFLPLDANVSKAELTVTRATSDAGVSGMLRLYFSISRGPDGTAQLNDSAPSARVVLNASAMNDFIRSPSQNSTPPGTTPNGTAYVPLSTNSCSFPRGWDITFSEVLIVYTLPGAVPNHPPVGTAPIADLTLLQGNSKDAGVNLESAFADEDGDPLQYAVVPDSPSDPGWSFVTITVAGNDLHLTSQAPWAGALAFRVKAADPDAASALSNSVTLTVTIPDEPPRFGGTIGDLDVASGHATSGVLDASLFFEDPNGKPLTYTAQPEENGSAWSEVAVAMRGAWLDVTRAGTPQFSGHACLALRATDVNGSWADSNLFCLVFQGEAAAALEPVVPLSIQATGAPRLDNLTADRPITFTVTASGPLEPGVRVLWYVDGALWSEGPALEGITLPPGRHEIRVEFVGPERTEELTQSVHAVGPVPPLPSPLARALPYLFGITVLAVGIAVTRSERGRFFLIGAIVGAVFARLKGESLLNHFVRGRLYQVIREHPGVRFNELKRLAEVPNGTAVHHLKVLAKGGLIRIETEGVKTRFYAVGARLDDDEYGLIEADALILTAVQEQPGISIGALSKRVERSPSSTSRAVSRLATLGYLRRTRSGRGASVFPQLKA